jgi:hypothetical protein
MRIAIPIKIYCNHKKCDKHVTVDCFVSAGRFYPNGSIDIEWNRRIDRVPGEVNLIEKFIEDPPEGFRVAHRAGQDITLCCFSCADEFEQGKLPLSDFHTVRDYTL